MRKLPAAFAPYKWAPSTKELGRRVGLDSLDIVRFDGNVPARPPASAQPATVAAALTRVNEYAHGGYPELLSAIADYAGVEPENIVLGVGADDLILLCARAFAGPGDQIAIAAEPTYPLYAIAAGLAGADIGTDDPVVTFCCRPNNPTGALDPVPDARPLIVDEAYWEYAGETAIGLIDDGVVVLRTFSKAFALAGARVGYALADAHTAAELNRRQAPLAVSGASAALALAGLADPPDVTAEVEERNRLARALAALGLEPLRSRANFLFLPLEQPESVGEALLRRGLVVRVFSDGIRFNVRDREDDDLLLEGLTEVLGAAVSTERANMPSTDDVL
jgi:histidinol-phosphate aminotransferase